MKRLPKQPIGAPSDGRFGTSNRIEKSNLALKSP